MARTLQFPRIVALLLFALIVGCANAAAQSKAAPTVPRISPAITPTASAGGRTVDGNAPGIPQLNGVVQTLPDGLGYIDEKVGEGAVRAGQTVSVHYTGWLTTGQKFDSSRDRGQSFSFPLGAGRVIKGWDEGVATMQIGGKRRLIIPPALGYGAQGAGASIPPNSTLIFDVELLAAS